MADKPSEAALEGLKTLFDPATCVRKGLCPVTKIRGQEQDPLESHSLYFEQHGTGPEKILFIMGLNSTSFSWLPQVEHFSRTGQHTLIIFDNRGVGNSGTPRGPYTTSAMAQDVIALLDYVGWTKRREIHVVGASLGGMIALELSTRIPERIASLVLAVTTAGGRIWNNFPPWKGLRTLATLFFIKDPEVKAQYAVEMLFPTEWLGEKAEDDPEGRDNRTVERERFYRRVAASRPQPPLGAISQMAAGLSHYVSPDRLRTIASTIPKVIIASGDEDNLVAVGKSAYLHAHLPGSEYVVFPQTGHGLCVQQFKKFNALVERAVQEGRALAGPAGDSEVHAK